MREHVPASPAERREPSRRAAGRAGARGGMPAGRKALRAERGERGSCTDLRGDRRASYGARGGYRPGPGVRAPPRNGPLAPHAGARAARRLPGWLPGARGRPGRRSAGSFRASRCGGARVRRSRERSGRPGCWCGPCSGRPRPALAGFLRAAPGSARSANATLVGSWSAAPGSVRALQQGGVRIHLRTAACRIARNTAAEDRAGRAGASGGHGGEKHMSF